MQGLESRAADPVDGHGGDGRRESPGGRVLSAAGGEYLAEQYLVDLVGGHTGMRKEVRDDRSAELGRGETGECAAEMLMAVRRAATITIAQRGLLSPQKKYRYARRAVSEASRKESRLIA